MKPSWIRRLSTLPTPAPGSRPQPKRRARLTVELLEDRCVPATITVNSNGDAPAPPAGTVTLRSAILQAEADATPDTLVFAASLTGQTITLTANPIPLTKGETITGLGATSLTVSGSNAFRAFNVTSATLVTISGLTITAGNAAAANGGGVVDTGGLLTLSNVTVSASTAVGGGGIDVTGAAAQLTLTNSTVTANTATGASGGGISIETAGTTVTVTSCTITANTSGGPGGGIDNFGGLTVNTSTISGNTVLGANNGGGIENRGTGILALNSSTVTGNIAGASGAGVRNIGTATITNSTITNNTTVTGTGAGISSDTTLTVNDCTITGNVDPSAAATNAGGISQTGGTFLLNNTIVAKNFTGNAVAPDVRGTVASGSGNFIGIADANLIFTTGSSNQLGTVATPKDPLLGSLRNNGGTTFTRAPLLGSPVINTGVNAAVPGGTTTDQRGFLRISGTLGDIGAVEFQAPLTTTTLVVTPATPTPFHLPLTLTATVTAAASSGGANNPLTGTVTFLNGAAVLGTGTLDATGKATLTLKPDQPLPSGTDALTARFEGDFNYGKSLSNVVSQVVSIRKTTPGVFDPATGMWFLRNTNSQGPVDVTAFQFGAPGGDTFPVVGDWQGTGVFTVGVYTRSTATFQIRFSNTPGPADVTFAFGRRQGTQTFPVAGDWSGTGKWGVGVFDASNGNWNLRNELSDGLPDAGSFLYGAPGSKPVVGDWNGGGSFHIGVIEPDGTWKLKNNNTTGTPDFTFTYGGVGSTPITGDWNADGVWTPGVVEFNGGDATWKLRNSNSAGAPDITAFPYGGPGTIPVPGTWIFPSLPLLAAGGAVSDPGVSPLDAGQLGTIVSAALGRLSGAGLDAATLAQLASAVVEVRPLDNGWLGEALPSQNRIYIDSTAAGHGWFVDPTPYQDEEFAGGQALPNTAAVGHTDLLSVVLHEMGHLAGLADNDGSDLMGATLATGVRRTDALDAVFAGGRSA
jgi:hypothetical protein